MTPFRFFSRDLSFPYLRDEACHGFSAAFPLASDLPLPPLCKVRLGSTRVPVFYLPLRLLFFFTPREIPRVSPTFSPLFPKPSQLVLQRC